MKRQVRQSVFETNSSSTHSLSICTGSDWDKWMRDEVLMKDGEFLEKKKAMQENAEYFRKYDKYSEDVIRAYLDGEKSLEDIVGVGYLGDYWHSSDEDDAYLEDRFYESFGQKFTTPSGETVVAFGYYGENR